MIYFALAFLSIMLVGVSQTLFKIGAGNARSMLRMYVNLPTVTGYLLSFVETICSIYAMRGIELKLFYALASLCYVVVLALSVIVLKEKLSRSKLFAILLIVCGIAIFNL